MSHDLLSRVEHIQIGALLPWLIVGGWLLGAAVAFWFVLLATSRSSSLIGDAKTDSGARGGCIFIAFAIGFGLVSLMGVDQVLNSFVFVLGPGNSPFESARQFITSLL